MPDTWLGEPIIGNRGNVLPKGNARGSGYEIAPDNWYVEPLSATVSLLGSESFWGTVWDPACGQGNILKVCQSAGLQIRGSDLVDRGYPGCQASVDFLNYQTRGFDHIISNPPFNYAAEFALRALETTPHKVALFVRLAFLEGQARHALLFKPHPPARVLVFRRRISCPPGGGAVKAGNGSVAYCWIVWRKDHIGPTQLDWI